MTHEFKPPNFMPNNLQRQACHSWKPVAVTYSRDVLLCVGAPWISSQCTRFSLARREKRIVFMCRQIITKSDRNVPQCERGIKPCPCLK